MDFTKFVLVEGRASCLSIVELRQSPDGTSLEFSYFDYLNDNAKEDGAYIAHCEKVPS
jgi:hypothetical protein